MIPGDPSSTVAETCRVIRATVARQLCTGIYPFVDTIGCLPPIRRFDRIEGTTRGAESCERPPRTPNHQVPAARRCGWTDDHRRDGPRDRESGSRLGSGSIERIATRSRRIVRERASGGATGTGVTGVRRSEALLATSREAPDAGTDATALLRRAGLIRDFGSGLYGFLPTGERVLRKVRARIEAAMDAVGAQRVGLPALQYSGDWRASGRWESFEDEMFTLENRDGQAMCLAPSHEEGAVRLLDGVVRSHDDLPLVVYQVGEKYRDDHARNGLVRCKAFEMKDAYSVHASEDSLAATYRELRAAYLRVFDDVGLDVAVVPVDDDVMGGAASEEFVAPVADGSDRLVRCTAADCRFGRTAEAAGFGAVAAGDACPDCGDRLAASEGIEVGHVFQLGRRYTEALGLTVDDAEGGESHPTMGSYGIGITRVVQTLVQQRAVDAAGAADGAGESAGGDRLDCRWPVTDWGSVAPYRTAIVPLDYAGRHGAVADDLYRGCGREDVLLYDDPDQSIGERFAESALLGVPAKVVVGNHYDETGEVELERADGTTESVAPAAVPDAVAAFAAGEGALCGR